MEDEAQVGDQVAQNERDREQSLPAIAKQLMTVYRCLCDI